MAIILTNDDYQFEMVDEISRRINNAALNEASRSSSSSVTIDNLEKWNGKRYKRVNT